MTTHTLQPPTIDSYINSLAANSNYGTYAYGLLGYYTSNSSKSRVLTKHDLSGITASDVCDDATLSLKLEIDYATSDCIWDAYALKRNWVENQVTWNIFSTGNSWSTAGAAGSDDIYSTALGSSGTIANNTAVNTWIDITLDPTEFKKFYDGTYPFYGFMIKARAENVLNLWRVYSRENSDANSTKLVVNTHSGISVAKFMSVPTASIKKANTVAIASVKKISGI